MQHFTALIKQKEFALQMYDKQRKAKELRYEIAVRDLEAVPHKVWNDWNGGDAPGEMTTNPARYRAEKVFRAEQYEYESSVGNLDFMSEQVKRELEQLREMLKHAETGIIDPRSAGVVM